MVILLLHKWGSRWGCVGRAIFGGLSTLTLYITCNGPGDLKNGADMVATFLGCHTCGMAVTAQLRAPSIRMLVKLLALGWGRWGREKSLASAYLPSCAPIKPSPHNTAERSM